MTVNLLPVKDNTLYEDAAGNLSNGAGNHIFAGLTSGGSIRRGLIAFDIAGNVPAGATIESVTLTLSMSRTQSGPMEVQLRKVLADWGEGPSRASGEEGGGGQAEDGDATWVHRSHPNEEWSNPGGDFAPAASASAEVARVGSYTWGPTEEMGADVQGWLGDAATNFGWALIADEAGITTAKRFDSRENPDEASRPVLTITYAP